MKLSEFNFRTYLAGFHYPLKINNDFICGNFAYNTNEVELWTGLYDEKGKKIYENDILKIFDDEEVVAYYKVSINFIKGIELQNIDHFAISHIDNIFPNIVLGDYLSDAEIIGNIHENPELLKC